MEIIWRRQDISIKAPADLSGCDVTVQKMKYTFYLTLTIIVPGGSG
jgi:hypothetical protein